MGLIWDLFLDRTSSYISLLGNLSPPQSPRCPIWNVSAVMALKEHIWAVQWQLLAKASRALPIIWKMNCKHMLKDTAPSSTWELTTLTVNILLHLPIKTHKTSIAMGRQEWRTGRPILASRQQKSRGNPALSTHSFTYSTKSWFCTKTEAADNKILFNEILNIFYIHYFSIYILSGSLIKLPVDNLHW